MGHPEFETMTCVNVDDQGTRRVVETRKKNDPSATWIEQLTSRPIRAGETPEQAAADSIAFARETTSSESRVLVGAGGLSVCTEFPDGSSSYVSFARPD